MSTEPTSLPPPLPAGPAAPTPSSRDRNPERRQPSKRRAPKGEPDEPASRRAPADPEEPVIRDGEPGDSDSEDAPDAPPGKGRRVDVRV